MVKIRYGFVSNSSSTSFVINAKKDIELKDLVKLIAMGMEIELREQLEEYYQEPEDNIYKGENRISLERSLFGDFKNMFILAKKHIPELENFEIVERYKDTIIKERRY